MESFTSDADGDAAGQLADDSEELDDFGMSGWGQFGADEPVEQQQPAAKQKRGRQSSSAKVRNCWQQTAAMAAHVRLWRMQLAVGLPSIAGHSTPAPIVTTAP